MNFILGYVLIHLACHGVHEFACRADGACLCGQLVPQIEVVARTGEGHVEEVEIFNALLEVLLVVGIAEVGLVYLLVLGGDGHEGQAVERRSRRVRPDNVGRAVTLEGPVHVGHKHGVEVQSLAFVNGHDADALPCPTLYAGRLHALFPILQEGGEVGRIGFEVAYQLVHKGHEIRCFLGLLAQVASSNNALATFVEGNLSRDCQQFVQFGRCATFLLGDIRAGELVLGVVVFLI